MKLRTQWRPKDRFLVKHKDDDLIVVDKKAGLLSVRAAQDRAPNLLGLLREFLGGPNRRAAVFPVHRLDRTVSGLLVFARTHDAREGLIAQFAKHKVERRYVAMVHGVLEKDRGTFKTWLKSDPRTLRMLPAEEREGKLAVTHWKVIERYPKAKATLVEIALQTGLRNQIRVQFKEAGFPLFGERKYAEKPSGKRSAGQGKQRIFLHAKVLAFRHPRTKKWMRWETDLPTDLLIWKRRVEQGLVLPPPKRDSKKRGRQR